jgi:polysaccharide export outer membrane protein
VHAAALALLLAGCATNRYRYDRSDTETVELRDLEELLRDSLEPGAGPGEGLDLTKRVVAPLDMAAERDVYRIGPNDVLDVYVMDHPELSSQRVNLGEIAGTVVHKDGRVYLPVIGDLPAAGLTVVEFAEQLRSAAARYVRDPQVSVQILRHESQKFFVLGQVARPGAYPVDGDTTLLEALGLAGGVGPEGNLEAAYVLRDGQLLPVSLADMLLRGDVSRNVFMRGGDVVFVPDAADQKVFVLGEVARPTVVPIARNRMTLAEALATAGGPTAAHARRELAVIRGGFDKPVVYTIDLEQALLVDDRIALRPGDRVVVAPTGLSTSSKYMLQILPFLQGAQAAGIATQGASAVVNQVSAAAN